MDLLDLFYNSALSGLLDFSGFCPFSPSVLHISPCRAVGSPWEGLQPPASPQSMVSTGDPYPFQLCFLWEVFFSPSCSWQVFTAQFIQVPLKLGCVAEICDDIFMVDVCGCEGAEQGRARGARAPKSPRPSLPRELWSLL